MIDSIKLNKQIKNKPSGLLNAILKICVSLIIILMLNFLIFEMGDSVNKQSEQKSITASKAEITLSKNSNFKSKL